MRADLSQAQTVAWERLADPGVWWTGAARIAIAAESRHALLSARSAARARLPCLLHCTPARIAGLKSELSDAAIEAVHRIRTDSGRLGDAWFLKLREAGLAEEAYVELVSVVAVVTAIDTFRRAAGLPTLDLPTARPGAPSQRRPYGARPGLGWVATLAPQDRSSDDPDLYGDDPGPRRRPGANIQQALSLVPEAMIHWWDLLETMYQTSRQMRDFARSTGRSAMPR